MLLRNRLQSISLEKLQVEQYLEEALRAGEQLRENRDSAKLATLQKAQEVESLSKEVARLFRKSFSQDNEIFDLKGQCNERQAEIERLNEVIALFLYFPLLTRHKAPECRETHLEWQGMRIPDLLRMFSWLTVHSEAVG